MKNYFKIYFFCFLYITSVNVLRAQSQLIGIKGGLGPVLMTQDEGLHLARQGFALGLVYNYQTKSRFTYGAELLYERHGYGDDYIIVHSDGRLEKYLALTNFNYITVPLLIGYTFGNKFYVKPSVGLSPGFLLTASSSYPTFQEPFFDTAYRKFTGIKTVDIKNTVNTFNLSAMADITIGCHITGHLDQFLSVRFQGGLTSISRDKTIPMWNNDTYFSFGVRYRLTN